MTAPDGRSTSSTARGAHRIAAGKLEPLAQMPFTVGQVFGADGTLYGIPTDGMRIVRRRADGAVDKLPADKDLPGTVYSVWETHGPKAEREEILEAARVDAVWDRLVERGLAPW